MTSKHILRDVWFCWSSLGGVVAKDVFFPPPPPPKKMQQGFLAQTEEEKIRVAMYQGFRVPCTCLLPVLHRWHQEPNSSNCTYFHEMANTAFPPICYNLHKPIFGIITHGHVSYLISWSYQIINWDK